MSGFPRFLPQGDAALVVELGDTIDRAISARVTALAGLVRAAAIPGVLDLVPTYRSLLIHYDPLALGFDDIAERAAGLLAGAGAGVHRLRLVRLPVCYDTDLAPDLTEVATLTGLDRDAIGRLHAAVDYHVYMIGFLPGYPYMGDLPEPLRLPRLATPRLAVPPRSVAIAGTMTAIYPLQSPGGWRLIGAVPMELFDLARDPPSLLAPGDRVRFNPVSRMDFDTLRAAWVAGAGTLDVTEITGC